MTHRPHTTHAAAPLAETGAGLVPLLLLLAAVAAAWAPVLWDLAEMWSSRPETAHGYLVLPASLYFAWMRRDRLRRLPVRPNLWLGLTVLLGAAVPMAVGQVGGVLGAEALGLVAMAFALVLLLWGTAHVRVLLFPLLFLLSMTPVLEDPLRPMHWPLQLATAKAAGAALSALGIPAYVEQQYIVLPSISLEVAKACSGVGLFVAIVTVALAAAYLMLRRWQSWAVLVAAGLVVGVVANWLRVTVIGLWAEAGGEVIHGPMHIFQAMSAAVVAYVGVVVVALLLARRERRQFGPEAVSGDLPPGPAARAGTRSRGAWAAALAVVLLLDAHLYLMRVQPVPIREPLVTFPTLLGPWTGVPADLGDAPFRLAGASQELYRRYAEEGACGTDLYVAYLPIQHQGLELVNYRSAHLHEGARTLALEVGPGAALAVNANSAERPDGRRTQILFWYEIDGHHIAARYDAMGTSLAHALLHRRNNGALVLLADAGNDAAAWHGCLGDGDFIARLLPVLGLYL